MNATDKIVQPAGRVHLDGLQVIRGIAALAVVLFHEQELTSFGPHAVSNNWFTALFKFGYAGVDIFFVLSGFLIVYVHYGDIGRPSRISGGVPPGSISSIGAFVLSWYLPYLSLQDYS